MNDIIIIKLNKEQEEFLEKNGFVRLDDYLIVKDIDDGYYVSKLVNEPFKLIFESEED